METIDRFHRHLFPDDEEKFASTCLPELRARLWNILDFNDKTFITKVRTINLFFIPLIEARHAP